MERKLRTPVELTETERAAIRAAMKSLGVRSMAEYLRIAALAYAKQVS